MSNFLKKEQRRLDKLNQFQLSNQFKKIGWVIALVSIALLFLRKLFTDDVWTLLVLRHVFLNTTIVGFLLISLAKEKVEDELIVNLRSRSYRLAFVFGVLYSLVQPYINVLVESMKATDPMEVTNTFSYFQVIIFMLIIQIAFFETFKRSHS